MKHYLSVEILSNFQNVKSSCANVKPPIENFMTTDSSGLNLTSFRTTAWLLSILSSLKK